MMAHTQLDVSLNIAMTDRVQFVAQGLNLNNAPFGYYTGTTRIFIQKELYCATTTSFRFRY